MMPIAHARLSQASAIIEEAAEKALHFFAAHQTVATHAKGVQDFVSEADTTVENFIRDRLAAIFPGEAIVGEEFGGQSEGAYWIIDPIDGTSNFLRGSPLWESRSASCATAVPNSALLPCRSWARSMRPPMAAAC